MDDKAQVAALIADAAIDRASGQEARDVERLRVRFENVTEEERANLLANTNIRVLSAAKW